MNIMSSFETGATTEGANNLVLSVLNDGAVYEDRKHCGFAMLQGASHRMTFKDIAHAEAAKQRAQGCKFKPQEITEAAKLVQVETVKHCLEIIRDEWDGENIHCYGRKWFDKVNGNTYFSARIVIPTVAGSRWVAAPFQYGYGDQWQWECRAILERMGFSDMAKGYGSEKPLVFTFEGERLKREMYDGLYI